MRKRIQEYGIVFGETPRGPLNAITDVPGVRVGHHTLHTDTPVITRTGVTAIIPHDDNIFENPITACSHVINGFGKSVGLMQIQETGLLETPILLTNTLNVGNAARALIDHCVVENPKGLTINPIVLECNDGLLNDIQAESISKDAVFSAIDSAKGGAFECGSVGAGKGMVCYEYKGGIGTSSRLLKLDKQKYFIGCLVLTNFGIQQELTIKGVNIEPFFPVSVKRPGGSNLVILATDIPMTHRQLKRMSHRVSFGIARTGGRCAHNSGELVLAFSTANRFPRKPDSDIGSMRRIHENDRTTGMIFNSTVSVVEEAIVDSLFAAETVTGIHGNVIRELPVEEMMHSHSFPP